MTNTSDSFKSIKLIMDGFEPHHYNLLVKQNSIKSVERPIDRTLFVINIPPYITKKNLECAFNEAGKIGSIFLCHKPGDVKELESDVDSLYFKSGDIEYKFKVAYIVFKSSTSLQNVLNLKEVHSGTIHSGISKWSKEYKDQIPDPTMLQKEIDSFMYNYDATARQKDLADKEKTDNDGWVTVTKKLKRGFEQKEAVIDKIERRLENGKKRKELQDFYRFQIKESKIKHIVGLRKKFEEDRKKIDFMKKSRRFKPF